MSNNIDIPVWLIPILVACVAGGPIAMAKYIFNRERGLMMTKEAHLIDCNSAKKEMREGIKEEFTDFRDYFKREVELKVLESLRNLNGTLEQKIAGVVIKQIEPLNEKIDRRLGDLVEITKHLAKKK